MAHALVAVSKGPPGGVRDELAALWMNVIWAGDALGWGASYQQVFWGAGAHHGADLAVLRGHAVSVVQVGEGLGRPPRLQVPGHAHGRPHLGSIEGVARSEEMLGTPSLSLGARKKVLPLCATGACLLSPCPF